MRHRILGMLLLGLSFTMALTQAAFQDPDDDAEERMLLGERTFQNSCVICHSAELVRQNALTPPQWTATIDKMINWGAPVAPEEKSDLHAYLVARHGADVRRDPPTMIDADARLKSLPPILLLAHPADTARGEALFASHCLACHGTHGQGGEPGSNLVEQPVLLDPAPFRAVVRTGRGKMPSFAEVLDEPKIDDILAWLRDQRYRPAAFRATMP